MTSKLCRRLPPGPRSRVIIGRLVLGAPAARHVDCAERLVSWAVGVGLGRFDVRFAIHDGIRPPEPDPFDPLPDVAPGVLSACTEASSLSTLYPFNQSPSPVLVLDSGHELDLARVVREVFDAVFRALPTSGGPMLAQPSTASKVSRAGCVGASSTATLRSTRDRGGGLQSFGRSERGRGRIRFGSTLIRLLSILCFGY